MNVSAFTRVLGKRQRWVVDVCWKEKTGCYGELLSRGNVIRNCLEDKCLYLSQNWILVPAPFISVLATDMTWTIHPQTQPNRSFFHLFKPRPKGKMRWGLIREAWSEKPSMLMMLHWLPVQLPTFMLSLTITAMGTVWGLYTAMRTVVMGQDIAFLLATELNNIPLETLNTFG